jgi:large subunit ribosomal protein L13
MLPKNKLGNALYGNLKVCVGAKHDHAAQNPELINLDSII